LSDVQPVVDSQIHLWSPDPIGWLPLNGDTQPRSWGKRYETEDFVSLMRGAEVDRAILIPPSWERDPNSYCLAAARRHPERFTLFGRVSLFSPDVRLQVAHLSDVGAGGVRTVFMSDEDARRLGEDEAEPLWSAAEELQLPVMIYAPGRWDDLERIATRHPGLRLCLDHLGLRVEDRFGYASESVQALLRMAKFDNVTVKVSGLPAYSIDEYPFRSSHAAVKSVISEFGAHRTFWGSDFSRLSCSYQEAVGMVYEMGFLTDTELGQLMGKSITDWLA